MANPETRRARQDSLTVFRGQEPTVPWASTSALYRRISFGFVVTDVLALETAILVTRVLHNKGLSLGHALIGLLLVAPVVFVIVFAAFHLYSAGRLTPAEEFRRLLPATAVTAGVGLLALPLFWRAQEQLLSHAWLGVTWLLTLGLVLVFRQLWHKQMGRLRTAGRLRFRTLIVGANEEAEHIAEALKRPASGFLAVGAVHTGSSWMAGPDLRVLGSLDRLGELVQEHGIECVFVASTAIEPDVMKVLIKVLRRNKLEVRVSANLSDILASRLTVQPVGNLLALSLHPAGLSGFQAIAKRVFDVVVGALTLAVAMPLLLVVAALIKLTSRGPVLYRSERIGRQGQPFTMFKFRTMIRSADLLLPELASMNEASGPLFKMRSDPRVTKVGRWLRAWSLDELPQLVNVLGGTMSLVGPRPALPREVATYEDWHRDRLEVRPGMTGIWQVQGRSHLPFDDYVRLDLFYIENWTITYDLFILVKTIPAVLFRKGAF